jgi:hypothetical protein
LVFPLTNIDLDDWRKELNEEIINQINGAENQKIILLQKENSEL